MTRIDTETKRKLREMGVPALIDALETQDDTLTLGMVFEERIKLVVDDAGWPAVEDGYEWHGARYRARPPAGRRWRTSSTART